tara:strand:+ start:2155 stop:2457 length:303 start_codon:yes stop_codon:yes gene_type:complete
MAKTKEKEITKEQIKYVHGKTEKISEEHLKELQDVVNKVNTVQFNVGKIEGQKHRLLHDLAILNDNISLLQDKMTKEYGTFDININDGTINWPKEDKNEK